MVNDYPFELVDNLTTEEKGYHFILKSMIEDTLDMAEFPYMNLYMEYIVLVSNASKTQFTYKIINRDGATWSFERGLYSHSRISEMDERLAKEVKTYLEDTCRIKLSYA